MSRDNRHEIIVHTLRQLRREEKALIRLLERSGSDADARLLRDHRRQLATLRSHIEEKLPEALRASETCLREIAQLRSRASEVHVQFEQLRQRVRDGSLDVKRASTLATDLQVALDRIMDQLSREEQLLATLQDFLPGISPRESDAAPDRHQPRGSRPPRQTRADADHASSPADLAFEAMFALAPDTDHRSATAPAAAALAQIPPPDECEEVAEAAGEAIELDPESDALLDLSRASYPASRNSRDKRIHRRVPFTAPVRYRSTGQSLIARSTDLSVGGVFIETAQPLQGGTFLTVVFAVDGFPVEVESRVTYAIPEVGMGVRFVRMTSADRAAIENAIQRACREVGQLVS